MHRLLHRSPAVSGQHQTDEFVEFTANVGFGIRPLEIAPRTFNRPGALPAIFELEGHPRRLDLWHVFRQHGVLPHMHAAAQIRHLRVIHHRFGK